LWRFQPGFDRELRLGVGKLGVFAAGREGGKPRCWRTLLAATIEGASRSTFTDEELSMEKNPITFEAVSGLVARQM
jgi:hypothetical protein